MKKQTILSIGTAILVAGSLSITSFAANGTTVKPNTTIQQALHKAVKNTEKTNQALLNLERQLKQKKTHPMKMSGKNAKVKSHQKTTVPSLKVREKKVKLEIKRAENRLKALETELQKLQSKSTNLPNGVLAPVNQPVTSTNTTNNTNPGGPIVSTNTGTNSTPTNTSSTPPAPPLPPAS
jgi:hypothetical protein